jgi:hypothetical protein
MNVRVTLHNESASTKAGKSVTAYGVFTADDKGTWKGKVVFPESYAGKSYVILVKGQKQLQRKVCASIPKDADANRSECSKNKKIALKKGDNVIDMSGLALLAGDTHISGGMQDGEVNASDFLNIKSRLGKTDADSLSIADMNLDGGINSMDYALLMQAYKAATNGDGKEDVL